MRGGCTYPGDPGYLKLLRAAILPLQTPRTAKTGAKLALFGAANQSLVLSLPRHFQGGLSRLPAREHGEDPDLDYTLQRSGVPLRTAELPPGCPSYTNPAPGFRKFVGGDMTRMCG